MISSEVNTKKSFLIRAEHNSDIIKQLTEFAKENDIELGEFTAIGALKNAKLGFYNQEEHEYQEIEIDSPHEIASCIGNISLKEGDSFVHAHAVLADEDGDTIAGHLVEGRVFAAEIHLRELKGEKIERKHDEITDLSLWEKK